MSIANQDFGYRVSDFANRACIIYHLCSFPIPQRIFYDLSCGSGTISDPRSPISELLIYAIAHKSEVSVVFSSRICYHIPVRGDRAGGKGSENEKTASNIFLGYRNGHAVFFGWLWLRA